MSCEHVQNTLRTWAPEGPDLPDEVATHLDGCAVCRAAWDARFAPFELATEPVPAAARARHLPRRRRPVRWLVGIGGLAAAAAAALFVSSFRTHVRSVSAAAELPDQLGVEVTEEEEPAKLVITKGSQRVTDEETREKLVIIKGNTRHDDASKLEELGYLTPGDDLRAPRDATIAEHAVDVEHFGPNPIVRTGTDPLSTFAMDVDTASYTYARRTLRDGHLPLPDEVRIEEFVNYFAYDYSPPTSGPFGMEAEVAASPFTPGKHLVRIGLQGRQVRDRQPVHLTFLVDTSGSMQGDDRIGLVKRSFELLTTALRDGDTVAIAAYAGSAGVVLPPTPATETDRILAAVERLQSGGSTAMGAGLQLAYDLAERQLRPGSENRVIIASDGDANVGEARGESLAQLIRAQADRGITLTTLGFGTGNYRDATMERLADKGDGNYYYIDSELEARRVVVDRLTSTVTTIARDAKIQVDWDPAAVRDWHLLGYENRALADRDFRNDAVDAGEVGSGHQVTALYEVTLAPHAHALGTVRVRSEAPGAQAPASEQAFPIESAARPFAASTKDYRRAAVAAGFAMRLRGEDVSWEWLTATAATSANPDSAEDAELQDLLRTARALGR
jgi:Ca-activated chloride channel family protein